MTETAKTVVFVVVGVAALGVALLIDVGNRPSDATASGRDMIGKPLFEDFDALKVTELEIVKWDEETGEPRRFKVAQVNNVWSIPSHSDYAADAEDQLAEAATSVMGLKVVDFEGDNAGEFSEFGVVDPAAEKLERGTTGVATRVVMKNKDGDELVALLIGKEVPDRPGLRWVRRIGQDPIYTAKIDPGKLSTKFQEWIEDDLLKLSTMDVKQLRVLDYSFDEVAGRPKVHGQYAVEYDDAGDVHWKLLESKELDLNAGDWVDRTLSEQEELDTQKLNDLKFALDDLEIVDVERKPEGLAANLRDTGNFQADQEALLSLAEKGFYLLPVGERQFELISNEGEVRVLMKDGVQYTLRFGNIIEDTSGGSEEPKPGEEGEDPELESDTSDLNRYIFVMAEFNPEIIPKPELEAMPELPEVPEGTEPAGEEQPAPGGEETPAGEKAPAGEETPAGGETPSEGAAKGPEAEPGKAAPGDAPAGEAETPAPKGAESNEGSTTAEGSAAPTAAAPPEPAEPTAEETDPPAPADPPAEGETPAEGEAPADPATPPADPATPPADPATPPADPATPPADPATPPADGETPPADPATPPADPAVPPADPPGPPAEEPPPEKTPEEKLEEVKRQRERIATDNQRKQDDYQRKLDDGQKRVDELNGRFADWYYVISDEVYQKIHLSFDQIVKEKEKEEGEDGGEDGAAEDGDATTGDGHDHPAGDPAPAGKTADEPKTVLEELDTLEKEGPEGGEK